MNITKEELKKQIGNIQEFMIKDTKRQDLLREMYATSYVYDDLAGKLLDDYIEFIEKVIGSSELISWFVFDCDFGRDAKECEVNDKKFIVDSFDKLWEVLSKEGLNMGITKKLNDIKEHFENITEKEFINNLDTCGINEIKINVD